MNRTVSVILLAAVAAALLPGPVPVPAAPRDLRRPQPPAAVPLPPQRPKEPAGVPLPRPRPAGPDGHEARSAPEPSADDAGDAACLDRLAGLGVEFEEIAPVGEGECRVERPLRVSRLPDGLAVDPPATLACPAAEAMARWALGTVGPEAARLLDDEPVSVAVGTSWQCRPRRGDASGRLSEHARANGVDLSGFGLRRGGRLAVGASPAGSPGRRFEDAVRAGACAHFGTVLGPGSDAAHRDHLHLDAKVRRGGFRLCQ